MCNNVIPDKYIFYNVKIFNRISFFSSVIGRKKNPSDVMDRLREHPGACGPHFEDITTEQTLARMRLNAITPKTLLLAR